MAEHLKRRKLPTVGRNHTNAHNVRVHKQALLEVTSKHIPQKNQINTNGATSLQSQNQAFPNICLPTVERGLITVKSAGVHSAEQGI